MLNVYEFIAAFEAGFCKCYFDGGIRDQGRSETEVHPRFRIAGGGLERCLRH